MFHNIPCLITSIFLTFHKFHQIMHNVMQPQYQPFHLTLDCTFYNTFLHPGKFHLLEIHHHSALIILILFCCSVLLIIFFLHIFSSVLSVIASLCCYAFSIPRNLYPNSIKLFNSHMMLSLIIANPL